jgi:probable phosphomutase (TIGR03848 family)
MPEPTTLFLIRHGQTDWIGRAIAGRQPDVHLNPEGQAQALQLRDRLRHLPIRTIYSSPLERTRETAAPLAAALGLEVRPCPEAIELDFGEWTGSTMAALADDPRWRAFNTWRSATRAPGGELMPEVQTRIVAAITRIRAEHPGQAVALFSHGDVIRSAVAYFAGVSLDVFHRLEIRPASVSALRFYDETVLILRVNDTGELYT